MGFIIVASLCSEGATAVAVSARDAERGTGLHKISRAELLSGFVSVVCMFAHSFVLGRSVEQVPTALAADTTQRAEEANPINVVMLFAYLLGIDCDRGASDMTGSFRRRCPQELLAMYRSHLTELHCQMQARERTGRMVDSSNGSADVFVFMLGIQTCNDEACVWA